MDLLIGCGNQRDRRISTPRKEWEDLVTLDIDANCKPDVVHNLCELPLPFDSNIFDEIHAYQVLEHTGQQGDYRFFFDQFTEFWRILKPGGLFCGITPKWDKLWTWSDPGHTRVISEGSIAFLSQYQYKQQVGVTSMTDYRRVYKADFDIGYAQHSKDDFIFILKAVK